MPKKKREHKDSEIQEEFAAEYSEDGEGGTGALQQRLAKLKTDLAECRRQSQEYLDGWQRLKADVANMRRNESERNANVLEQAKLNILADFLPVLDSFDMARGSASWQSIDPTWRAGMEQVASQLEGALAQHGVTRFGKVGEPFDPSLHEAVGEVPAATPEEDGRVIAIIRSGWKNASTILRPAQVKVAHLALE